MTREERREAAKQRKAAAVARANKKPTAPGDLPSSEDSDSDDGEGDDDMPANPNHTAKAAKQATATPVAPESAAEAPKRVAKKAGDNLSRKEREALQAQQAKERYQKLHAEGRSPNQSPNAATTREANENGAQARRTRQRPIWPG